MQPTSRIAQGYGYAVCLICIITILICTGTIVNSLFNLSNPLRAEGRGMNLTSYTAYKRAHSGANVARPVPPGGAPVDTAATPPSAARETELRQMFEDERADQIGDVRFRSMRNAVSSVFVFLIAVGLFFMHWRWLRREDLKQV